MENLEGYLATIIIGIILWSILLYFIVSSAVKSAGHYQSNNVKMLLRMKAKQMRKQGFSYQEIYDLYVDSEDDFWRKLRDEQ
jgi:hypothetical protein